MIEEKIYFKPLTGVRAIAAYMVFLTHYNPFTEFGKTIDGFTSELYVGVTLFFVLSGFLISFRYFDTTRFSFRQYMVNRIARIYPIYFLATALTFIVFVLKSRGESNFVTFFLNISFLRGFFDDTKFSGIAQGWSLTVEETFYIMAPLFFVLLKRSKAFLFILPVALLLFGFGLVSVFSRVDFHGFFSSNEFMFIYTFFGRGFEFFIGMGLAIVYRTRISINKNISFTYTGIIVMVVCIYIMSLLRTDTEIGLHHPVGKLINSFLLPLGICLFFYGLLKEQSFVSEILGGKLFVLLGKSSYVFYLIHIGVLATFIQSLIPNSVAIFVLINLISVFLFLYLEDPLNKLLRRKL